jgi:hypothetical protein
VIVADGIVSRLPQFSLKTLRNVLCKEENITASQSFDYFSSDKFRLTCILSLDIG